MNKYKYVLTAIILILYMPFAYAGLLGPSDYDECIIESMKEVKSDLAARAIMRSCRVKFPNQKPKKITLHQKLKGVTLPKQAIRNLSGRVGINSQRNYTGHVYNGNNDWVVTQLTIRLIRNNTKDLEEAFFGSKDYNVVVTIPPLSTKDIYIKVNAPEGDEHSWQIIEAKGHKK